MLCIRNFWCKTFSGGDFSQLRVVLKHMYVYVTASIIIATSYAQVLICRKEYIKKYGDEKSSSVLFCFHK